MTDKLKNRAGLASRLTGLIVGFVARRPRFVMWPVLVLACAAVGITVSHLKLRTGRDALIDPAADFSQSWTRYTEDFSSHGDLIVVVETATADKSQIQSALDQIADRLQRQPDYFRDVLYRIDQRQLRSKGLQFLSPRDLRVAARRVDRYAGIARDEKWDRIHLDTFSRQLQYQLIKARNSGNSESEAILLDHARRFTSSLDEFLTGAEQNVRYSSSTFPSPWQDIVTVGVGQGAQDTGLAYLMTSDSRMGWLHVVVVPHERDLDPTAASITRLRQICDEVETSYRDTNAHLQVSVTGIPALEYDELSRAGHDMVFAALLALVSVGGLLSFGFRSVRHPMLVLLTLVVALSCTFGVATLAVGHLNILSICFAAVLIGLGVDFGVHFLSQYLHLRQETSSVEEALARTGLTAGSGIITSALTTALAFGSAALTGFPGLAELGIIAGSGILICATCTFLFLPALIAVSDAGTAAEPLPRRMTGRLFRAVVTGVPLVVIAASAIGIAVLGHKAVHWHHGRPELMVEYDSNLMHLQDPGLGSVQAQRSLWTTADESLLYAVAVAGSKDEALKLAEQLRALPSVHHVSELAGWLPAEPDDIKKQVILNLRRRAVDVAASVPTFPNAQPATIGRELVRLYTTLRESHDPRATGPADTLDHFLDGLETLNTKRQTAVLNAYQNLMAGSLLHQFERVRLASSDLTPVSVSDVPAEWRSRLYRQVDGQSQWLLKVYPAADIWNNTQLTSFVQEVRTVAPDITGIPVQNYEASRQLQTSWKSIAVYALAVISLFLLFDFLRPGQKVLTLMIPMAITGFVGYTMHQRTGELNPHLLVTIYLSMVVFIALVVDFRNLRDTILALVPPLIGAVLMAGTMAVFQVNLNPLNLVVLPLVLGIGVDDGVHMVHDYRRQLAAGSRDYSPSGETLTGVILTSLTSIVGFGSLMIAGHQGLVSVGMVMAIGVASCLLVALVPLPAILTLVARHQPPSRARSTAQKPKVQQSVPEVRATPHDPDENSEPVTRPMTRREKRRLSRAA